MLKGSLDFLGAVHKTYYKTSYKEQQKVRARKQRKIFQKKGSVFKFARIL